VPQKIRKHVDRDELNELKNLPVNMLLWRPAIHDKVDQDYIDIRDSFTFGDIAQAHMLCDMFDRIEEVKRQEMQRKQKKMKAKHG